MAKFSKIKVTPPVAKQIAQAKPDTISLVGKQAFSLDKFTEACFIMMTTFLENSFYRKASATRDRLIQLVKTQSDMKLFAQATCLIRREFGMRSVTHLAAATIANVVKGESWTKDFIDKVVYRLDDASEIMAAYIAIYGRKAIPNCLKKGLAKALGRFDEYAFAKYKGGNNEFKLIDLVNLVHPTPTAKNRKALKMLVEGTLKNTDTFESKLSKVGQIAENETDLAKLKGEVWDKMVADGELGYMAMLRNLVNILNGAKGKTIKAVCKFLTDPEQVRKSLQLPFRFYSAHRQVTQTAVASAEKTEVLMSIEKALELSVGNMPKFEGSTLIAVDVSGSMGGPVSGKSDVMVSDIAAVLAAALNKASDAEIVLFDFDARMLSVSKNSSVMGTAKTIIDRTTGGGTNFSSIFDVVTKHYDRIIILSDMQSWADRYSPRDRFVKYCQQHKKDTKLFSLDLRGYGTLMFPQTNVYCMAGFSDHTLKIMRYMEDDPAAFKKVVEAYKFD